MQVGQAVVVRGRGLGTVVALREDTIIVTERDRIISIDQWIGTTEERKKLFDRS